LLEKEHEGFRHFCRSEFDAKDALLIQAIFPREKCGEVDDGEGAGETEGNWVVGRDLCERLLEMPAKQGMCSFDQVNFFSPSFLLFSRPVKKNEIYNQPSKVNLTEIVFPLTWMISLLMDSSCFVQTKYIILICASASQKTG
jgi:hypothetical protein